MYKEVPGRFLIEADFMGSEFAFHPTECGKFILLWDVGEHEEVHLNKKQVEELIKWLSDQVSQMKEGPWVW
jgi:hypothetical protein